MTNLMCRAFHVSLLAIGCMSCVCHAERTVSPKTNSTPEAEGIPTSAITAWVKTLEKENCNVRAFLLSRNGKRVASAQWSPGAQYYGIGEVSRLFPYMGMAALVTDGDMTLAEAEALMAKDASDPKVSYELSAIVQKYSEKPLDQYVLRRILNNLGEVMAYWTATAGPEGLMNGGWGVHMNVSDLSRIGELLLSRGKWMKHTMFSTETADAIAKAIPLGKGFGVLGSKGQMLYIRPDLDMQLAVFACSDKPQAILEITERELVAKFSAEPLTPVEEDVKAWEAYRNTLTIPMLACDGEDRTPDKTDRVFPENALGITAGHLDVEKDGWCAVVKTANGVQCLNIGKKWRGGYVAFRPEPYEELPGKLTGNLRTLCQGGWMADGTFRAKLFLPEVPLETEITFPTAEAPQSEKVVFVPYKSPGQLHSIHDVMARQGQRRNSEGDIIKLKDGRLYLIWSCFPTDGDDDPANLVRQISADNGKTWSPQEIVVTRPEKSLNVMCVSLLRLADGGIALLYLDKVSQRDCRPVFRRSDDECATWSEPVKIIPDEHNGYYVGNNGRLIQLSNGRLLMPVMAPIGYGALGTYYSDDVGKTWHRSKDFHTAKDSKGIAVLLQEPGAIELKDGRVLMWGRTGHGSQYFMYSSDNGDTWTPPAPSNMISPRSPASIIRLSTGILAAVWNDHSRFSDKRLQFPYHNGIRNPLTIGVSVDEGETWKNLVDIETEGWNDYVALREYDGNLYMVYSTGSHANLRVVAWPVSEIHP